MAYRVKTWLAACSQPEGRGIFLWRLEGAPDSEEEKEMVKSLTKGGLHHVTTFSQFSWESEDDMYDKYQAILSEGIA